MITIPLAAPDLSGNEEKYVLEAVRSSWISSTGRFVDLFEERFSQLCNGTALSVCNGTSALHLALLALDVRPGDEVLVPSLTYVATANAVRYVGGEPIFVDVDLDTWCIDPQLVEAQITRRTKGIIAVHLYGHPADMDPINDVAAAHGLWVVEDAAEAHFAQYKGQTVGTLASVGTFSFYGNKLLTCGEGGAVTVTDERLAERIRLLRGQGMHPRRRYYFSITGFNFRLTNVACAILCAQLERHQEIIARRDRIFCLYRELLNGTPGIGFQPIAPWAVAAPWLFCITVDEDQYGRSRDDLMSVLRRGGVDTRPFFMALHTLPPFRGQSQGRGERLPNTDHLSGAGMNLPTYSGMSEGDVSRVAELVRGGEQSS
jgi:perosamine synthetase